MSKSNYYKERVIQLLLFFAFMRFPKSHYYYLLRGLCSTRNRPQWSQGIESGAERRHRTTGRSSRYRLWHTKEIGCFRFGKFRIGR